MPFEQELKNQLSGYGHEILITHGNLYITDMDDSFLNYPLMAQLKDSMEQLGYEMTYWPGQLSSLMDIPEVADLFEHYSPAEKLFIVRRI
jgi:hypothetical protein